MGGMGKKGGMGRMGGMGGMGGMGRPEATPAPLLRACGPRNEASTGDR